MEDAVVQWFVRRTWDLQVESLSPGWCVIQVVFFGKTRNSHSAPLSLHRRINENQQIVLATTKQNASLHFVVVKLPFFIWLLFKQFGYYLNIVCILRC